MSLRPYQVHAIEETRRAFRAGKRAIVIVIPTGGGKTRTAAEIIRSHIAKGGRALFLAHRTELVAQAHEALEDVGLDVGVIAAASCASMNLAAPVQVASTQTLLAREHIELSPSLVVLDEAHHYPAEVFGSLVARWPSALIIGLSATPARENGNGMAPFFDALVVATTIRKLTAEGYLAPLDVIAPDRVLPSRQIARDPADAYAEHCEGRQAVVFAPSVKTARTFLESFEARGIAAAVLDGTQPHAQRAATLARYVGGDLRVLVNCGILTEGWDHPPTGDAILARPCGSLVLYLQIAGRILRPHPSKRRALLIDLTGATRRHGRPDADRVYALEGRAIMLEEAAPPGSFCEVCGAVIMPGEPACSECGAERPGQEDLRIVQTPLKLLARDICAKDSDETRVERLARWIHKASKAGIKVRSAFHKFRGVYGVQATPEQIRAAMHQAQRMGATITTPHDDDATRKDGTNG